MRHTAIAPVDVGILWYQLEYTQTPAILSYPSKVNGRFRLHAHRRGVHGPIEKNARTASLGPRKLPS